MNVKKDHQRVEVARLAPEERPDALLELASLHYRVRPGTNRFSRGFVDGPERRETARELLAAHPELACSSIHAAALCGDLAYVRSQLAADPGLASRPGGKEGWPPLLFVCYGRLPLAAATDNAVAIARALLDAGADPDAHWVVRWEAVSMSWSAICGAIGDGEPGPVRVPPHPRAHELVTLLLDRGADVNQGQALYNTMLREDDDHWLRLLIERGLGAHHRADGSAGGETTFAILLRHAAKTNQVRRATVLLEHGADPNPPQGENLYRLAISRGHVEVAELLRRHGATAGPSDQHVEFVTACRHLDTATARRLLGQHPGLLAQAADLLIDAAAARDLADLAELLLALGVSPDAEKRVGGYRALHQAATANSARVANLLIDRGAAVDAHDRQFRATPLAWAIHAHAPATLPLLAAKSRDIFTLVAGGFESRLTELLQDPTLANATLDEAVGLGVLRGEPGETPLFVLPEDERVAVAIARLLLRHGADPGRRNHAGLTAPEKARARGLHAVAELLLAAACVQDPFPG